MTRPSVGRIAVEVCVGSLADARIAERAGADRLELNCALELDGLTPSAGLFQGVRTEIRTPIIAMARPRAGDFCYTTEEWETLIADARWLIDHGADGIAFGALTSNRQIDRARCDEMRSLVGSRELVFHKAFDEVANWQAGLKILIEMGVNRVMTSGQQPTAKLGIGVIKSAVELADGRIKILPAGGINSQNAVEIVQTTGVEQIHGSFSRAGVGGGLEAEIQRSIELLAQPTNAS